MLPPMRNLWNFILARSTTLVIPVSERIDKVPPLKRLIKPYHFLYRFSNAYKQVAM